MSTNPMNPNKPQDASRLLQAIERQRLDRPQTESVLDLIKYHAAAEHLDLPLFTAMKQEKSNKSQTTQQSATGKGVSKGLTTEDGKAFAPLLFKQLSNYESLVKFLMKAGLPKEDNEDLGQILKELQAMQKKGSLSPEDLQNLTKIIQTLNQGFASKLSPQESQEYWAQVANMYEEVQKEAKKLSTKAPSKAGKALGSKVASQAAEDLGAAKAKQEGHESLAQMFIDAILHHFMPGAEGELTDIALMLQFQNFGATTIDDLLGAISDFGSANNDFNLNTLLQGSQGGKYPNGTDIVNGLEKERNACARDLKELDDLTKGLNGAIQKVDEQLKTATDPGVIKGLQQLKSTLQGQLKQCSAAKGNLTNLQKVIGGPDPAPGQPRVPPGTIQVTLNPDGTATVTGADGLAKDEDAVINGTGADGTGGLQTIYNDLKNAQQDYSNQSSTQQMQLQLTMTEVQQMWTIVSTCMTTLNQSLMTLAQSIYK